MCHFGPFRDIFGGNSFSEISDDFYALKLLFLPFFDQTIRNSQKMSIAVFQLFERNHYVPKALWYYYIMISDIVIGKLKISRPPELLKICTIWRFTLLDVISRNVYIRHSPKAVFNFSLEGALLPWAGFEPMSSHGH